MPKPRKRYASGAGHWMLIEAVDAGTDSAYDHEERLRAAFPSLTDEEVEHALRAYREARGRLLDRLLREMSKTRPEDKGQPR